MPPELEQDTLGKGWCCGPLIDLLQQARKRSTGVARSSGAWEHTLLA